MKKFLECMKSNINETQDPYIAFVLYFQNFLEDYRSRLNSICFLSYPIGILLHNLSALISFIYFFECQLYLESR